MIEEKKIKEETNKEESKKVANFTVTINATNGSKFYFSGPEVSTLAEREGVAYALNSEYIIAKWKDSLIKKNKEEKNKSKD